MKRKLLTLAMPFVRRLPNLLLRGLAVWALACLIIASMELTRVLLEGTPLAVYLPDLKGRAFFTITPLLALVLTFFWCLTNRLTFATLLGIVGAFLLIVAHLKKMAVLEKPLVPGDFTRLDMVFDMLGAVFAGAWTELAIFGVALLVFIAAFVWILKRKPRWPLPPAFRIGFAIAFIAALTLEIHVPWLKHVFASQNLSIFGANYERNLRRNGLLLNLLINARQVIYRPLDDSREAVERALASSENESVSPASEQPDVILFLGESFWDPTRLNVTFSRDPIPNFHRFQADSAFRHGSLTSPSFAGGTGNVEFEILTGIPLAVLPNHSTPYSDYLLRPIEALPAIFKNNGYEARAIHNYFSYYYQAFATYPLLGFDEFISLKDLKPLALDMVPSTTSPAAPAYPIGINLRIIKQMRQGDKHFETLFERSFPSDEPLVLRVLEQLEQSSESNKPQFIFAISIVSHGLYLGTRFPSPEIEVTDKNLPSQVQHELETYANLLFRADRALGYLLDRLSERSRPTVLAFFGDHLPPLTPESYAAAGMIFGPYDIHKYEIPCFLWSNRPLPEIYLPTGLGAHAFASRLLDAAHVPKGRYFTRVHELENSALALGHNRLLTPDGRWFSGVADPNLPESARQARDTLFLLAWDRLFGHQFSMTPGGVEKTIKDLGTFEIRVEKPWDEKPPVG